MNDDQYYQIIGNKIIAYTVSTGQSRTVRDYNAEGFTSIETGGTGDLSKDNWMAFVAKGKTQICAIELATANTYCADYSSVPRATEFPPTAVDFPMIAKGVDSITRKRYVMLIANPSILVFSVDLATGSLVFEFRGPEYSPDMQRSASQPYNNNNICDPGELCLGAYHMDTMEDIDGQQYIVTVTDMGIPCQRQVTFLRISANERILVRSSQGGGRIDGLVLNRCGGGPYESWTGSHIGCARNSAYCVLSILGNDTLSTQSRPRTTFESEVIVISGTGRTYRRLAQTRSVQFLDEDSGQRYWSQPHAAISANGSQVLWDTNFGYIGRGRSVVTATTGFGPPTAPKPLLRLSRTKVIGGEPVVADISLSVPVYGGTLQCVVTSSRPLVATVPNTVDFVPGSIQTSFQIKTTPQPTPVLVEIAAVCQANKSTAVFVLEPPHLDKVTFNPSSTVGGQISTLHIQMTGVLAANRTDCTAKSDRPEVLVQNKLTLNSGSYLSIVQMPTLAVSSERLVTVTVTCPPTVQPYEWPGIPSDAPGTTIRSAVLSVRQVPPPSDKIGFFRAGGWVLDRNGDRAYSGPTIDYVFPLGISSDYPIAGDWTNTGTGMVGIYRDGVWYFDNNGDNRWEWGVDSYCYFGIRGDIPILGDWTGDGKKKLGVYRNGTWFLDRNGNRQWDNYLDSVHSWGQPGDIPIVGDWTGNGISRAGLFRKGLWLLDLDGDFAFTSKDASFLFGAEGDIPLVGDWLGNGRHRPALFRGGIWILDVGSGADFRTGTNASFTFGYPGDKPVVGRWK